MSHRFPRAPFSFSLGDMRATEPKEPQAMFDELRHLSVQSKYDRKK